MLLKDKIKDDMITAMKAGEKIKLATLRSVLGAITDAETSGKTRKELEDNDVINVLKKLAKTRRESATIYVEAGAHNRADTELEEAIIIESYLPAQLTEEETKEIIVKIIDEKDLATQGMRGIGVVMKELKNRNDVDSATASKLARSILQ